MRLSGDSFSLAEEIITVRIMEIPVRISLEIPLQGRDWRNIWILFDFDRTLLASLWKCLGLLISFESQL